MQYSRISAFSRDFGTIVIPVTVVIMVIYSENLLCFAICDIYLKNLEDREVVLELCLYFSFQFIKSKNLKEYNTY